MKTTTLPLHKERAEFIREYLNDEYFIYSIELIDNDSDLVSLIITCDNNYTDVLSLRLFHAGLQYSLVQV